MKKLKIAVLAAGLLLCFSAVPAQAQSTGTGGTANGTNSIWDACNGATSGSAICASKDGAEATAVIKKIINVLLFAIGILSVIMIIHSGLKYTTSRGDAEQIKSAKNTLLYAVIGIIVAVLAFAIVNFVIGIFKEEQAPIQGPPAPAPAPIQGPPAPRS